MHATPDVASVLKPLADFYIGRAMPEVRFINPGRMPKLYRQLLDHSSDMTSTLQRFHNEEIRVHVLESRRDDTCYEREVLLVTRDRRKTVEFGAIEILLERFPTAARREILRAEMPLGAILRSFRIEYKSKPRAFFEIDSDAVMNAALLLSHSVTLYGRCNEIKNSENHLLAEIVEILPPGIGRRQNV
jgi:chorismate-pyruvate lyase